MGEMERSAPLYTPLKPERLVNRMSNGSGGRSFAESTHTSELTMGFKGEAKMSTTSKQVVEEEEDNSFITISTDTIPPPLVVHQVCLPPQATTFQKLKHRLHEIFFPDDPFYIFKNQSFRRKLVLGFQYFFPILQWGPSYSRKLFTSDIISGLTIASLAIPQGISYAKLANLPPIIGLYSSFVPPLVYSVLGSSRHIGIGPVSIASLVMGTMLNDEISATKDGDLYVQLAFTSTLFAGLFQASLGLFRLGFIIDFLSKATLIGFMAGAAVVVALQQLKGLLGITHFTGKMQIIPVMDSVFNHKKEEGIAVGRTFASMQDYQIDGNKEMLAMGVMNTVAMVLVALLFLMPLFYYTPNLILSAIIITAVIGLIDYKGAFHLWKVDKLDFLACLCSFFGVLFFSVQLGLGIAVGVSLLKIILHVSRPDTMVLGNIPDTQIYQSLNRYKNALRKPRFLILGIESPILFANSTYLLERVLRWVREEEERIQENNESALKCVILDMAVTAIDTSGIDAMFEIRKRLNRRSLHLVLVNLAGTVMAKLHQSKILDLFRPNGLYLTIGEAVADISSSWNP
ncbi:hypothetical protein JRO89_XS04G0236700 [Xanthoceras sorbifolium]|uniref:STAS domain-containing protein n=1 Tax=Xanthoceras sorbifolium TaxID=99658 RepID=A0ABQ8I783_9ROSI|nr:hypothetical protein JRO89_XS04G0236700 [Xanthoceras sorbifolium]